MREYKTYQKVLVCILPFVAVTVLYFVSLYVIDNITFPECTFHKFTGMYCPGCGDTRAVIALVHGDILLSMRQNVLVVVIIVSLIILYIELVFRAFGKKIRSPIRNYYFLVGVLIFVAVYTVARNIFPVIAPI